MGLRQWVIVALAMVILLCLGTPAGAWLASKLGAAVGDFYFGMEYVVQRPTAKLFHSQDLATTDTEALAISFPSEGNTFAPSIAQTNAETATATDTGFFTANWCYTTFMNAGGYELVPEIGSWHPIKSSLMVGSGVSWPYMNNAPLYGETMTFSPSIDTAPDTSQTSLTPGTVGLTGTQVSPASISNSLSGTAEDSSMSGPLGNNSLSATNGNRTLTGTNLSTNTTASPGSNFTANASGKTSKPNRDYKNMTKQHIQNSTGLERVYRNANMKNTVPQSYKGTVERPTTIAPLEKPADLIKPANQPQVLSDAVNMTGAGTHLKTLFWDL